MTKKHISVCRECGLIKEIVKPTPYCIKCFDYHRNLYRDYSNWDEYYAYKKRNKRRGYE